MPAPPAPVDLEHLARYTGGARDLNVDLLRLFADQCAQLLHELEGAISSGDGLRWRQITHSLKGGARGIGAFAVADAAAVAEPLDLAFEAKRASAALATLRDRIDAAHTFIRSYLEQ